HQRLVPMMNEGITPVEVYIDECHRRGMTFLAGFRINDRHGHNADLFEKLNQDHPDWILREYKPSSPRTCDPRSHDVGCALDYSVEAVRDWVFSVMEDAASRFDIDGIELNYHRLPACFPKGQAEASHAIMTGFVRRVRAMLDEAGRRKGRKLLLGARVLVSLAGCRKMGMDVPTWIEDRLVDYVAPGDIGFTDPNARYEEFVHLARQHDCFVYPQIQAKLGYHHRELVQTAAHCRADARNFYGAGADGVSLQNYFDVQEFGVLKELRDADGLASSDRHYVFYPIWGPNEGSQAGYEWDFPYTTEEVILDRNSPGVRRTFRFRICEHLPAESRVNGKDLISGAKLIFRPGISPGDELAVDINGHDVGPGEIQYEWPDDSDEGPLCRLSLSSPAAVYGDNHLGLTLVHSASGPEGDILMNAVEVIVKAAD
ncbi:MAG: family 10 glycosylhydrolase, partial [Gemmatimonadetes bacterium]|nr:family 10 glycosylhydrolase [Gemmatimonadota bacterium]